MNAGSPRRWLRDARRAFARLPSLRMGRVPDAPALPVRDPWPGDAGRGARLLRGELEIGGGVRSLHPGSWGNASGSSVLDSAAHGFTWLRDLRALNTCTVPFLLDDAILSPAGDQAMPPRDTGTFWPPSVHG